MLAGLLGLAALVHAQDKTAPVVTDNKPWRTYTAELQDKDNTTLRGQVTTYGPTDGVGIRLKVSFWGIPEGETLRMSCLLLPAYFPTHSSPHHTTTNKPTYTIIPKRHGNGHTNTR